MIVTCERCSTQFRLDDKRVPAAGVRVRCSRCKHAFRVDPPAATEEERVDQAAARALEPDTPDITQDMAEEEADWEFNDERTESEAGAEGDAAPSQVTDLAMEATGTTLGDADAYGYGLNAPSLVDSQVQDGDTPLPSSGLEFGGPAGHAPSPLSEVGSPSESASAGESADREGPGFQLERAGAASDGLGPSDAGGSSDGLDLDDASERPSGLDLAGGELELEAPGRAVPTDRGAAQGASSGEMGSPDKWDFFAETSSRPARSRISSAPVSHRPPAAAAHSASQDLIDEDEAPQSAWLGGIGAAIGWTAVAALFVGALYAGFAAQAQRMPAVAAAQQVGGLQIDEVSGRWVDNLVMGDLYVVSARSQRDPAAAKGPDGGLFLVLLDAQGERIKRAPVPFGPPLPDALLRQANPSDLQRMAAQQRFLRSGAMRQIEAVVASVPAQASAFRVVASDQLADWRARAPTGPDALDSSSADDGAALPLPGVASEIEPGEPL